MLGATIVTSLMFSEVSEEITNFALKRTISTETVIVGHFIATPTGKKSLRVVRSIFLALSWCYTCQLLNASFEI